MLRQRLLLRVADLIDAHHIDPDDHLISGSCVGPRRQQQKNAKPIRQEILYRTAPHVGLRANLPLSVGASHRKALSWSSVGA